MAVDPNIKKKADDIRNKVYGKEVRESLASGLEAMSTDVVDTVSRQGNVESQFQDVIENTTDKDVISAPEIIAARNGEANLKTRIDKDHQEVTTQLAQTAKNLGGVEHGLISNMSKELPGENSNDNLIVFAPLNESIRNLVDNSNGDTRGDLSYEEIGRAKGVNFNLDERITYPVDENNLKEGTLFLRFKPKILFDTNLNSEFYLLGLFEGSSSNGVYIKLNYLDGANYNGIETTIREGNSFTRATYNNIDFNPEQVYTIALTWRHENPGEHGTMSIYLDGKLIRAAQFSENNIPANANSLIIGNVNTAGNRSANSVIGDVLYYREWLPTSSVLKMTRYGLNEHSTSNKRVYEMSSKAIGYQRTELEVAIAAYDEETNKIFGYSHVSDGRLMYSLDEGNSFELLHDFGYGKRIRMVHIDGNNLLVSVDEKIFKGNKHTGNFYEVLEFSPGFRAVNGWGITQDNDVIYLTEYGQSTTTPQSNARLFKSTDRGETWEAIFSLPEEADHIHAVKIDPYTGFLWLSYGDNISGTLFSTDDGENWEYVYNNSRSTDSRTGLQVEEQVIDFVFTDDLVIMASDKRTSYCFIAIYNKVSDEWSRLVDVPQRYLSNVFAIHLDEKGLLWWYANNEGSSIHRSSLWISYDLGASAIMLEDLEFTRWGLGVKFVETENYIYIDRYRINKKINMVT